MINLGKVRLLIFALLIIVATEGVYAQENSYDLLWNYATNSQVNSISISPDGSYIAAGTSKGEVHFFNKDGKLLWNYTRGNDVTGISISSKGSHIALASKNNLYVLSKEKKLLWSYDIDPICNTYSCELTDVSVTSDGSYVVAGSTGYRTSSSYFYGQEGNLIWNYTFPSVSRGSVYSSVSLHGPYIAIAEYTDANNLYLLNKEMEVLWNYTLDTWCTSISISSDGSYIVVGCGDEKIYFFDKHGKLLWSILIDHNIVGGVSLSSDGSYVAVGAIDGIYLFSKDAELLWKKTGVGYVHSISVSSDGSYIAAGTGDKIYLFARNSPSQDSTFVSGEDISSSEKNNSNPAFSFPTTSAQCEVNQVMYQGECIDVSSLLKNNEYGMTEEDFRLLLGKLEREKLEELKIYFEGELLKYLAHHKYEEAEVYALKLKDIYYQLGDREKVQEIQDKYKEIKSDHVIYKLKHPFHNPLEVFFAVIFAVIFAFVADAFLHIRKNRKSWQLIVIFIGIVIVTWATLSVILTIL